MGGGGTYETFDELRLHWRSAIRAKAAFYALLLSTKNTDLEEKLTDYAFNNIDELKDMSGQACWIFTAVPELYQDVYRQKPYSIGRLLNVMPEQFPCIVFFDRLVRPKQTIVFPLAPVLGADASLEEIQIFFRMLFSITHTLASVSPKKKLQTLEEALLAKWDTKKTSKTNLIRILAIALPVSKIIKNISSIATQIYGAYQGRP